MLNVMRRPFYAAAVNLGQMFVIFVPLALLGNNLFGIHGIFIALAISLFIAGAIAWRLAGMRLKKISNNTVLEESPI